MLKTILITGAAGKIGQKLRPHFTSLGWKLILLDINPNNDPEIIAADLACYDEAWGKQFQDVEAVIHLAADSSKFASWESAERNNIKATENILRAAQLHGVKRIVFASSSWVMAGHRFSTHRLTTDLTPKPVNPYGISKLIGERLGAAAAQQGLCFIALRIGNCQHGLNLPGPHMQMGAWGQQMWLSDRDLCQAMERAVLCDANGYLVLNLMSDNQNMRWDIKTTQKAIGYTPQDGFKTILTRSLRLKAVLAKILYKLSSKLGRPWL